MLIYEDEYVQVIYHPGRSDFLLSTFSELSFTADGVNFWGRRVVEKLEISTLGYVAKGRNWFPVSSMCKLAGVVDKIRGRFNLCLGYGFSMGAYAAIKYSSLLRFDATLAFSAQYSIDPRDRTLPHDWEKFYLQDLHDGMAIGAADVAGAVFLVSDPYSAVDAEHTARIARISEHVTLVPMPFAGHGTIRLISGTEAAKTLFEAALAKDALRVRRLIQAARRTPDYLSSSNRLRMAVRAAGRRPTGWRLSILMRSLLRSKPSALHPRIFSQLRASATASGFDTTELDDFQIQFCESGFATDRDLGRAARILLARGQPLKAMHYAYEPYCRAPESPHAISYLASLTKRNGFLREAERIRALKESSGGADEKVA
jgi:hypothetical protein